MILNISLALRLVQNLNVSNVSNRFNQFLIPALVFKNSALDGSNDKMWSKVCRHQNVKFDLSTQVDFW